MKLDEIKVKNYDERKEVYKFLYMLCNTEIINNVKSQYEKHLINDVDYIFQKDRVEKTIIAKK